MEIVKRIGIERRRENEIRKEEMLIQEKGEAPRSKGEVEGRSLVRKRRMEQAVQGRVLGEKEVWGSCTTSKSTPNSLSSNWKPKVHIPKAAWRRSEPPALPAASGYKRQQERSGSGGAGFMGWWPCPAALRAGWLLQRRAE